MSVTAEEAARGQTMITRLAVAEPELVERLSGRLEAVEKRLFQCVNEAQDPFVAQTVGHLIAAGGKRMRPLLALVAAEFGPAPGRDGVEAAVVSELIHVASLYHDDVMDDARVRHGVASANVKWGNAVAVQAGNWLLSRAAHLVAGLGPEAVRLQAYASDRLVEGQMRELLGPAEGEDRLTHYFRVISDKSASLLSLALRIGAMEGGAAPETMEILAEYGEHLGVAFQMSDDLLDISSSSVHLGKEQGKDLAVGVASLPILLALDDTRPPARELRELLASGPLTDAAERSRALDLLNGSPVMAEARSMMDERLARATALVDQVPDRPAAQVLRAFCTFVASRTE
ncbi:polyprenyl synthetase family protein [Streptomyces cinnamoneus]|uniref:Polyprenyl-diphosphate synthase GrcC1 n=1 Tax=Streptomyces cinnamoneus TaxID=53446 RepID=A0A918TUZ6_STRCJ|nr:polyprenyl synthetase family protein [Streptomyces cinnamoneus]GHC63093.1 putative polyprenyl-diphosphate synthase GrcC1 [Streptomyces cinnamoneus]